MGNTEQHIWNILAAILNGSASPTEKEEFDIWIQSNSSNQTFFNLLKSEWEKDYKLTPRISEKIYEQINHKISKVNVSGRNMFMRYAAIAVVALLLGGLISNVYNNRKRSNTESFLTSTTHLGVKTKIVLPDSSIVYLNSGSSLDYPDRFSGGERIVKLKGEAYFEVSKDALHPFKVSVNNLIIKVLGTHFNVKAYPEDDNISTSLLEGAVSIEKKSDKNNSSSNLLSPNQQAVYQKSSDKIFINQVNAKMYMVWTKGQFYFEHQNFQEIAKQLEREFNVKIQIQTNHLKQEVFTGIFKKGENLYTILDVMKNHRGFNYREVKGGLEIYETVK